MIIDTHSHLNFNAYKKDLDEVIKKTLGNDILAINVGSKYKTSKEAVEIAERYEGMYASIGLHPIYCAQEFIKIKTDLEEGDSSTEEEVFDKERYKELAKSKKVVAIGEIGLDYYYKPKTAGRLKAFKEKQKEVFIKQLELAEELALPVILHCRMAHNDMIEILKSHRGVKGVIHCFTGDWDIAQKYMHLGFLIGMNGIIFKMDLEETVIKIPLTNMLVETDCPYLTPPEEGNKRNEPLFIKHVIKKIAEIKEISFDDVADETTENAKKLFKL